MAATTETLPGSVPETALELDRASHTIRLTRSFAASPAEVFAAWTRPEHVARWWDPAGAPLAECTIDLRPGGAFRFVTRGHPEMPFAGVYREISPPDRLVFEANGATGTVALATEGGTTRLTVTIACGSAERFEQYLQHGIHHGTGRTLDNLVAYLG